MAAPDPRDKRFADPEWSTNQFFDFLKQAYLLTVQWADHLVKDANGLDPHTQQKAEFYVRQIVNAIAPSNFVLTNPELLRETLASNADNLARGMHMLAEDIEAGGGDLKIRQSDPSMFEVGRNLALTPGKVIFQNDLMQLIQYAPTTEKVLKRPLLIVPPWINKFYILDLTPEKSFIKWCVDQGLTVFVISWVNPDAQLAKKIFEDYMREGPLAALDVIKQATGETKVNAIGYCVGGTLLAVTLALHGRQARQAHRVGDLLRQPGRFHLCGRSQGVRRRGADRGASRSRWPSAAISTGRKMANAFNLLRSNDLIWPYVINNYFKGKEPLPVRPAVLEFRRDPHAGGQPLVLPAQLLSREQARARGKMAIAGKRLDLGKVKVPIYNLATREDHIAPAKSVLLGSKFFGGPVRFVLSGSGHIAGVVNPPAQARNINTGPAPQAERRRPRRAGSPRRKSIRAPGGRTGSPGSRRMDAETVTARKPGGGKLKPIEDAPGSYVKVRD